jgi:CheY-like chemotaxis protein
MATNVLRQPNSSSSSTSQHTLLIAAADEARRSFLAAQLDADGHTVYEATGVDAAVARLSDCPVDVLLLGALERPSDAFGLLRAVPADEHPRIHPGLAVITLGAGDELTTLRAYEALALKGRTSPKPPYRIPLDNTPNTRLTRTRHPRRADGRSSRGSPAPGLPRSSSTGLGGVARSLSLRLWQVAHMTVFARAFHQAVEPTGNSISQATHASGRCSTSSRSCIRLWGHDPEHGPTT